MSGIRRVLRTCSPPRGGGIEVRRTNCTGWRKAGSRYNIEISTHGRQALMRSLLLLSIISVSLVSAVNAAPTTDASDAVVTKAEARQPITITYLGNAGWQIEDGKTTILVDPFLSEFRKNRTDTEQITADDPIATPDAESIDAHVHKADYILVTHGHIDHMLDARNNSSSSSVAARTSSSQIFRLL